MPNQHPPSAVGMRVGAIIKTYRRIYEQQHPGCDIFAVTGVPNLGVYELDARNMTMGELIMVQRALSIPEHEFDHVFKP